MLAIKSRESRAHLHAADDREKSMFLSIYTRRDYHTGMLVEHSITRSYRHTLTTIAGVQDTVVIVGAGELSASCLSSPIPETVSITARARKGISGHYNHPCPRRDMTRF